MSAPQPLAELEELLGALLVVVYDERKPTPKRLAAAEGWWALAGELCAGADQQPPGFVSRSILEVGLALCAWRAGQAARPENAPELVRERLEAARTRAV